MSALPAPPGYANSASERELAPIPSSLAAFAAALASVLLFAFHELCLALPRVYSLNGESNTPGTLLAFAAAVAGAFAARSVAYPASHAPASLGALSLLSSGAGYAFYGAFSRGPALEVVRVLVPTLSAALLGLAACLLWRAFGRGFAALGVLVYFLNPLRALLLAAAWLLALSGVPLLSRLHQAALIGGLLAGCALLTPFVAARFVIPPAPAPLARALSTLAPFAALTALLGANWFIPLSEVRTHSGDVVYALAGPRGQHVISKLQGGLVLFSNQVVAITGVDATRFAEALVHPALAIAEARDQVLALDDAAGAVEREILRWPDVTRVTLVPSDPALFRLARTSTPLRALGAAALDSQKLDVRTTEPAVFVLNDSHKYSIILANLADPIDYLQGKYFTVRFFEAVRERLAPGGIFALQVTSPERTPRSHASILSTLREAGFSVLDYRAPLPTLGEWGFALAVAARPGADADSLARRVRAARFIPGGTSLVTQRNLRALFERPRNAAAPIEPANFSYHQALLELYHDEEARFSE